MYLKNDNSACLQKRVKRHSVEQWSPAFLVPRTGFVEDSPSPPTVWLSS